MSLGSYSIGAVSLGGSLVVGQEIELELVASGTTTVSLALTIERNLALAVTGQTVVAMDLVAAIPLELSISGGTAVVMGLRVTPALVVPTPTSTVSNQPFPFDILGEGADVQFDQQLYGSGNLQFDREAQPREMVFDQ